MNTCIEYQNIYLQLQGFLNPYIYNILCILICRSHLVSLNAWGWTQINGIHLFFKIYFFRLWATFACKVFLFCLPLLLWNPDLLFSLSLFLNPRELSFVGVLVEIMMFSFYSYNSKVKARWNIHHSHGRCPKKKKKTRKNICH